MLKNGAKANCSNMHGLTPLHYAARLGNLDMISLLLTHGAFIGQVESFFWTPLHYAVYHGWEAAVTKLLESAAATNGAGQLVNETDSLARSALHVACRQGHLSIAAKLLAHGAQLVKDSSGHSPFYYLAVKVRSPGLGSFSPLPLGIYGISKPLGVCSFRISNAWICLHSIGGEQGESTRFLL